MKHRSTHSVLAIIGACMVPLLTSPLAAEEVADAPDTSKWVCKLCPISNGWFGDWDLGLIYVVNVMPEEDTQRTNVQIEMTMTSPACPAGPQLIADAKRVVGQMDGVGDIEVKVVMDPPWTPDRMTDDARDELGMF